MQIIHELVNGFAGAPNGTATILKRGTTTPATYYTDFEGKSPVSAGTTLDLDSAGAAKVFVNEYVDVLVVTAAGVTLEQFNPANASPNTEVRSLSFTGADYDTAAVAAGNPVNLQTVLDRWLDSAGAVDWKVLVNGTATNLSTVVSGLAGLFFNVKDVTYGAKGNGTTDDTTAIQAAIDAATVVGGVVYFPGTTTGYRTTSALVLPDNVSLLGVGTQDCSILLDHATNNIIQTSVAAGTVYNGQSIRGLRLACSTGNTGSALQFATTTPCSINDCYIGGANSNPATRLFGTVSGGTGTYRYTNCTFEVGGDFAQHQDAVAATTHFDGCDFEAAASALNNPMSAPSGRVYYTGVAFGAFPATGGTFDFIDLSAATSVSHASIIGCRFLGSGPATSTAIKTQTLVASEHIFEYGNSFNPAVDNFYTIDYDDSSTPVDVSSSLGTRENAAEYINNTSSGTTTPDPVNFGNTLLVSDFNSASLIINMAGAYPGARYTLAIQNDNATTITNLTFTNTHDFPASGLTIATGQSLCFTFTFFHSAAGTSEWYNTGVGGDV